MPKLSQRNRNSFTRKKLWEIMEGIGVNKITVAERLKQVLMTGTDKEAVTVARILLSNYGEVTDKPSDKATMEFKAPTIIYMGASEQMLRSLKTGGRPIGEEEAVPVLEGGVVTDDHEATA